jgi:hypothetical protein
MYNDAKHNIIKGLWLHLKVLLSLIASPSFSCLQLDLTKRGKKKRQERVWNNSIRKFDSVILLFSHLTY